MSGLGVVAVGLVLCFAGLWSLHLAVLASGFALGWLLAEALGGSLAVTAIVALCAAVVAWVLATLVFRTALFVVGAVTGGVIGAKLFGMLQDDGSALIAVVFVVSVAFVTGVATQRFKDGVLAWACALAGAGLVMSGLARIWPDALEFLRTPDTAAETVIATAAWIVLAVVGWSVQRRMKESRTEATTA
jgi:hypothetical protein